MSGQSDEYELGLPSVRVEQTLPHNFNQFVSIVPAASDAGDYYVLNATGEILYVGSDSSVKRVANFNQPIRLLHCYKGVVVVSPEGIVFRQTKDEHSTLRELSHLPKLPGRCNIEFTPSEVEKWVSKQALFSTMPAIMSLVEKLKEKGTETGPFMIEIQDAELLLKEIRQYSLKPTNPYTELEPSSAFPGLEFTNFVSMNSEMARRMSFYNWPRTDCLHVTPENLAAAGFFSRPGANNTDRVMCFSCNLYLVNWEVHDEPMQEHEKHGRTCSFVQNNDQKNVTAEQTMSILPMRHWSNICGSDDVQFSMNDLIIGAANPDSTWVSVAVPPRAPSQKPSIFLFDLTKVAAEPVEILLDLFATCMVETMGLNASNIMSPQKNFNWLSSVDEIPSDSIDPQPLCKINALATSTSFDECTVTLRGEKIVALLCAAVSVDDNRLGKSLQQSEAGEVSALNTLNKYQEGYNTIAGNFGTYRRPFILVYHVVEFPDESLMTPLEYANMALRGAKAHSSSAHHSTVVSGQTDAMKNWTDTSMVDELLSAPEQDILMHIEKGSRDPEFVPVYYNPKKIAAVGIQCIRLPPEYDETSYQVDQLQYHSSGAFIVASVNTTDIALNSESSHLSALLVYSRVSMLHMLNEKPIAIVPFKLRISKVVLLEEDYFGSTNMPRENALSTDVLNETVVVLFEDGSSQIVDLDYRRSVPIDCPPLKDVSVNESGEIIGLTMDGQIIGVEVVHSLPKLKGDLMEELAISVLAATEKSGIPILLNERIDERLSRIASETPKFIEVESALQNTCICSQHPLSVEQVSWIWSLTRSDARIRPAQIHGSNSTGSARSHPSISHNTYMQSTVGVAVQVPVEFTEYINAGLRERHHPAILSTPMCQLFCILNKYPYSDIQTLTDELTRTWQLKPKKDASKKTYVFELSITFGLSLSHINLSLGLAGYVRGVSDVRMSVFIPKASEGSLGEEAAKFFGDDGSASSLPGPSSGLSAEHYLSMFGEKPEVLEQNYHRCIGPLNIEEFIDPNNKQAVIQLSVVQLLLAAARTELKDAGSVTFDEGWMFHSQRFYVLVEVNERSTTAQKAYCQILHANTHEQRHQDLQPVGSKRTRSMDTSTGGIVPLPLFKSTDRRKHLMKARGSSRKRFVQNFAETVTQSAMKPYSLSSSDTASRPEGPILTCLEYITLTALKSTDKQTRSNMQRCLLLLDTPSHSEILRAAVGIIPKAESTNPKNTADNIPYYRMLIAQQQSWDILHWIITQLRVSRDQERAVALATSLKDITYEFVYNCFVVSSRSIARKAAGFMLEIMDLLRIMKSPLADELLNEILNELIALLTKGSRFRHSGAMRWLTTMQTELVKSACVRPLNVELRAKIAQLTAASALMVTKIGEVWHSRRSTQRLALSPTEFCPDPLTETSLFEFPPQVATIVVDAKLIGAAHSAAQTMFAHYKFGETPTEVPKEKPEIPMPSVYAAPSDSNGVSSVKAYKSSRSSSSQSRPYHKENAWINELTPLATVYVLDELKEADIKWFEHVGLNSLEPASYPIKKTASKGPGVMGVPPKKQPYSTSISEDIFHTGQSVSPTDTSATNLESGTLADVLLNLQGDALFDELRNRFSQSQIRRFLITSEHLPGLIEVERLNFNINSSTVQLRILDLNALSDIRIEAERPVSALMDAMPGPKVYFAPNSELRTPLPLSEPMMGKRGFMPGQSKNLSLVQSETSNIPTSADTKLKSLAELYVLERRRTFTERRRLLPSTPPTSMESAPQSSQTPASAFFPTEQTLDLNFDVMDTSDEQGNLQSNSFTYNQVPKGSVIDNPIITRRSSSYVCEMNGCTSGQIFQIVLDFQTPFLLSDFLIPSNEVFSSVAVDGWLEDERHGIVRFAYSVEIENRCLIVSDIAMTSPIQFIRLSFAFRDSRTSEVTFMIGQFFGTRFFSPWHLYSSSGVFDADKYWDMEPMEIVESVLPFVDPHAQALQKAVDQQALNFKELEQLAQSVLLRFQSNLTQIRATARHGCPFNNKRLYQQCIADRILYNTYRNVLERSRRDMLFASSVLYQKGVDHAASLSNIAFAKDWNGHEEPSIDFITEQSDSFWDASSDELRFMAVEFMNMVNEANSFMQIGEHISSKFEKKTMNPLRPPTLSSYKIPEILTMESAVRLFGCFVCDMDPRLESLCCAYLFHQGSKSDWWADFFPAVIRRHFVASSYNSSDSVFVRLAYLCDQSVRYRDLQIPIFEKLLAYAQELISGKISAVDTTQLSWLLLLISSACDAVIPNDRYMDRWTFVCGQPCTSYPNAPSGEPVRRYSRKTGAAFKDQFFSSQYGPTYTGFGQSFGYVPKSSGFGDNHPPPMPDHASMVEMKKLGSEIKQSGKQLDTLLQSSQLNSDDFLPLKKEQKTLMSLYNTAQTYMCKGVPTQDSFVEKIHSGGFADKAETSDAKKAPLATQEDDLATDSDGTAKKLSIEAVQAKIMRGKLSKLRKTLYVLVKQHRNTQNTRTKFASSGIARRRFAVRMQLSYQTVIQTIRCLIRLICDSPTMLSAPTQILLFKVCAKLGVHGCRNPISFRQMMESIGVTQNLLAVVLENSAHYEWIRHALLCFVLDVVEAEGPTQSGTEISESTENVNTFKARTESEPNTPEAKVKRRKENPETDMDTEEKDMSPMDDENACSASTSTFVTNVDDDETVTNSTTKNDTDTETTAFENLVVSPTILASGISDGYATGIGEEREVHPALLEEKGSGNESILYPFSFPMFDKPIESDVDSLIVMALFALRPIEMKNPTYWDNYRDWFVRQIAFAVSRALYDKGEPISDIFRWFDFVLGAEMEAASNSKSENIYVKWGLLSLIHASDFIEREFGVSGKLAMSSEKNPSHSALTCAAYYSQFYSLFENNMQNATEDEDPNFLFLDDQNFTMAFFDSTLSARGQSETGNFIADLMSIIEKRRQSGGNATLETTDDESIGTRFYENLEGNYLPIDCGEDVVHFVAMRGCMPLYRMRRCVKNLPFVHIPDPDELVRIKPLETEKQLKSSSAKTTVRSEKSKAERNERREVDVANDEAMHYRAAMNVHFLNSRCCPMALGLDHLSTAYLEVHVSAQLRRCQAERLVSQCHFLNRMAPSLQRTVKMSTVYDTRLLPGMDTCSTWIVQAINHIVSELDSRQANERPAHTNRFGGGQFFQNLLNFFWDFQGNTFATRLHGADVNVARTFVLNEKAIEGLIRFAIHFEYMNEQTWTQLLKLLIAIDTPIEGQETLKEIKGYKFVQWVENSDNFLPFIHKFLMSSMNRLSTTVSACPSYGPAVGNVFGRFMGIVFKMVTPRVMDSILEVLTAVLREGRECGYVNFPVEMVLEITAAMDRMDRVCSCTTEKFAMFLDALMDFVSDFFSEIQRVQKHIGDEAPAPESPLTRGSDPSQISSNVCFSVVLGPNGQRERTALMNERFRATNNNGSKTTKNIVFTKRADILENALRDGDISSNSPFLSVAYSFLRLVVRYVSQYRPLLKAVVNGKNHCLKRAVDTLFMLISCTNHTDEINAENFKIVTVADALVHFLLIVSETSVEDPECGRQFIVLILNSLRARVTAPMNTNAPSTSMQSSSSPAESAPYLMDLPVPLLLLMKTLLSSVTRCQSFVEENGHIFVAEQLQLSLDACSQDWPAHTQFSSISRELNALTSHITGCESANPLVNSVAPVRVTNPAQICPSTSTRARRPAETSQPIVKTGAYFAPATVQCSSATSSPLTAPPIQPNLSLTCPAVTLQLSNVQASNHPFLGSIMPSTSRGFLSIRSLPPSAPLSLGPKDDQFNFAPIATFRSDQIPPSQLNMLSALPDKRGRTNTFTYKFTMKKEWIDFSMILPYKVILSEVIIRTPENYAPNAPSAIQLELSSDPVQSSWTVVGCPIAPGNCSVTRISVTSYRFPVTGVRIHLKCPTASPSLSIAQIQLIGSTSVRSMRFLNDSRMLESQLMNHWVSLFTRLCTRIDVPAWKYAPTLAESLIKVYLGEGHSPEIIRQVYDLLLRLDFNAKPSQNSLVAVVVNYLIGGGRVCPRAYLSVAELLHASCVLPSAAHHPQRIGQENRSINVTHSTAVARQRQLLIGIQKLLTDVLPQTQERIEESNWLRPEFLKEIAVLLWSAACVLWHNTSEASIRYDTIAICLEVGPVIIPSMARFVLYVRDQTLFCASCWMLCTLGRASAAHLNQIFKCLNLMNSTPLFTPKVLSALGKICQSATAVHFLIEKGFIQRWSKTASEICTQHQHHRISELLGIVDCLNQISVIDAAAEYFDNSNESQLFHQLLKYVVKFCLATLKSDEEHNPTTMSNRLADATISLLRRCLSYGGGHRQRIAQMMSDILLSSYSSTQKGSPLPPTVEDVLLRLIVADETITVRLTGVVNRRNMFNQNVEERMLHPLFGCNQDDRIIELSLSTLCQDLLPVKKRKAKRVKRKTSRTSQTLPNFEDWVVGSHLKFDDPEDKESAPPSDNRPSTSDASTNTETEHKFVYNQFVLQLICGAYSARRALNNSWPLSKVVDGLRALQRFGSRQSEDISLLEKYLKEDEEMCGVEEPAPQGDETMDVETRAASRPASLGSPHGARASPNPWKSQSTHQSRSQSASSNSPPVAEGEFTDGYFTLTLRVKASLQTNILSGIENENAFENIPSTTSTLFHFAQCGGLKLLSRSVDVLSRMEARIKLMISLSSKLQDCGTVKDDLEFARRSIAQCPLRQQNPLPPSNVQDHDALTILTTNGVKVAAPQYAMPPNAGEESPPKPMTVQAYGPLVDPIMLDPQQPSIQDDLMTMVDFMNSEIVSSSPKPITITSTAALQSFSGAPFSSYENDFADDLMTPVIQGGFFPAAYLDLGAGFSAGASFTDSKPSYVVKVPVTLQLKSDSARSPQNQNQTKIFKSAESLEFTMIALSNFLEIDSYPETLVECDPAAAKKLIYMMLGIDPPTTVRNDAVEGLAPLLPQSTLGVASEWQNLEDVEENVREKMRFATRLITDHFMGVSENSPTVQQKEMEMERLLLVPFLALSRCFENAHPTKMPIAQTEQIRLSALKNGSIDIVLTLLSHYSHQQPLRKPIREIGDFLVTNLVNRLISFCTDVQSYMALFSTTSKPPARPRLSKHVPLGTTAVASAYSGNEESYWAKGTGFGSGNTSTQWNLGHHVAKRKQHEITVTCLLNVLTNFIKPQLIASTPRLIAYCSEELANLLDSPQSSPGSALPEPPRSANIANTDPNPFTQIPAEFVSTVQRSCLNTTLNSYMMNDSVLDISRHAVVYESVVGLLLAICSSAPIGPTELVNISHMSDLVLNTDERFGCSIFERLKKLCGCVDIYMSKLKSTGEPTTSDATAPSNKEENLGELLNVAKQAVDLMKQREQIRRQTNEPFGEDEKMEEERIVNIFADESGYITGQSLEVEYNEMMKPRQFETIPFFQNENTPRFPYIYSNSMASIQGTSGKRTRRLAQEIVTLSTSLPLSLSSSVFLRSAEERLDVMKVLITGPSDTPYSCGCFEFDVYFPQDYPNVPMSMNLQTTGNRSVRFNPNLYEEGKVCLSILNTWSGRPEERWNSENSSFLQVLVSIQSLIFVSEPYFNEPGFERSRGTQQGDQSSRDYTANIRHQCIRWAMIEQLRKPSPAFADVIRRHFWVKRDEICLQIKKWISETREMVTKNTLMKSIPQHLTLMEKNFEALLNEFNKMECPSPELSHINSKFVHEHFHPTAEQPHS